MPVRNKVTPEGQMVGKQLAAWCNDAEPVARLQAPDLPPRCASCAFRAGEHLANGSPATQLDAMKCTIEQIPFYCHDVHRPDHICSGWLMMQLAHADGEARKVPWDFVGGLENVRAPVPENGG